MILGASPGMASPVESESESLVPEELRTKVGGATLELRLVHGVVGDVGVVDVIDVAVPGFVGVEEIIFEIEIGIVGVVVLEFVGHFVVE